MKKIEKEVKVTKWVADDGEEFDNEFACKSHETSEVGVLLNKLSPRIIARFNGEITKGIWCFDESWKWYIITPKTRNDYYVLNQILKLGCSDTTVAGGDNVTLFLGIHYMYNTINEVRVFDAEKWMLELSDGKLTVVSTIKEK